MDLFTDDKTKSAVVRIGTQSITLLKRGESASSSLALDVEYAVTDRLSASVGIPYVFAKYTGALPPPSNLPVDACQCWHSGFADLSLGARYRFGGVDSPMVPGVAASWGSRVAVGVRPGPMATS